MLLVTCYSRIQSEDILSKLTKFGVSHFERSYTEADRELFLISTAIQVRYHAYATMLLVEQWESRDHIRHYHFVNQRWDSTMLSNNTQYSCSTNLHVLTCRLVLQYVEPRYFSHAWDQLKWLDCEVVGIINVQCTCKTCVNHSMCVWSVGCNSDKMAAIQRLGTARLHCDIIAYNTQQ